MSNSLRLDSGASVLGAGQFDAFGTRIASTDSSTDPYSGYGAQWGYYRDSATGLSLLGRRFYDPVAARFLNRDPIGQRGGLNVYRYALNNPVGLIDPSGYADLNALENWAWNEGGGASVAFFNGAFGMNRSPGCNPDAQDGMQAGYVLFGLIGLVDGGDEAALAERGAPDLPEECPNGCFAAGTPVLMADGTEKPIEDVEPGDWVMSRDPQTGKNEPKRVVDTSLRDTTQLVTVKLADRNGKVVDSIICTPDHPYSVEGKRWVPASGLIIGVRVSSADGEEVRVASVERQGDVNQPILVYNLTVVDDHS